MSAFVDRHETRTIRAAWWEPATDDLPAEEVIIRKLAYGDEQDVIDRAMQVTAGTSEQQVAINIGAMQLNLMNRAVVSWTLRDGDKIAQLNFHNIRRLDRRYARFIQDEIDKLNPQLLAEERASFRGADSAGAEGQGPDAAPNDGRGALSLYELELAGVDDHAG